MTAKDAIDNGGAGRAAKGANPSFCAKNTRVDFSTARIFLLYEPKEGFEGGSRFARAKRFANEKMRRRTKRMSRIKKYHVI